MAKKSRKYKNKGILCAYCGVNTAATDEHVIPRCLFPDPKPPDAQLIIVPACKQCNADKAQHEDYLRDWLTIDYRSSSHPAARALFKEQVTRSMQTNRSTLGKAIRTGPGVVWAPMHSKGGIYIRHAPRIPFDNERMKYLFSMIGRGLFYTLWEKRLPDDCELQVGHIDPFRVGSIWESMQALGVQGMNDLADRGILLYAVARSKEEWRLSIWFLLFYGNVPIVITTAPRTNQ